MEVMDAPVLVTVMAAGARLGIGRSVVYELMSSGQLASLKIGTCRRIPVSAIDDYVARRLSESSAA